MDALLSLPVLIGLIVVALAFDFLNGLHDAANSIATIVSTRVLRPRHAVAWAAFFNFIAFLVFGVHVAQTVGVAPPDEVVIMPPSPIDNARNVAAMNGVVDIRKIEFYDEAWHVEGRDLSGHRISMTIDPRTYTIAHLERYD